MTKRLTDCFIFTELMFNDKLKKSLNGYMIESSKINLEDIQEQLLQIKKRYNFPSKAKIFQGLKDEVIIPTYNDSYNMPRYFNVFGKKVNGQPVFVVDLTRYASIGRATNTLSINTSDLFTLLQNAVVLGELTFNEKKYINNMKFIKTAMMCYCEMVSKVLDKNYAISTSPVTYDIYRFYISKFFLKNICGKKDEKNMDAMAYNSVINGTRLSTIQEYNIPDKSYLNIKELLTGLSTINNNSKVDNIRGFVESYVRMYGEGTLLSLEYLPTFTSVLMGTAVGANLNKDFIIASVTGKSRDSFINAFNVIV